MSFFANNPISLPIVESNNISSPKGTRGLIAKEDGWYDVDEYGKEVKIAETGDVVTLHPQSDWNQTDETKADYIKNKPDVLKANEDLQLTDHSISIDKTPFHEGDVGITLSRNVNLNVYGNVNVDGNDITTNLTQLNGVVEELTHHLDPSNNNPHGVTAEQIGAATTQALYEQDIAHTGRLESLEHHQEEHTQKISTLSQNKADILEIESNKATTLKLTDTKNAPLINYRIYGNANGVGTIDEETGKTLIPVTVQGKNLLPIKSAGTYSFESIGNCEIMEDGGIYVERVENTTTAPRNASVCSPMTVLTDGKYRFTEKGKTTRNIYTVLIHKRDGQIIQYYSNQSTNYDVINLDLKAGDKISTVLQIKAGATVENATFYLQLELGSVTTSYEKYIAPITTNIYIENPLADGDYIDYKNKKVVAQGVEYTNVDLPEIRVNYPSTSIFCKGEMQVTYKADTTNAYKNLKSELDTLKQAIISAGGTM